MVLIESQVIVLDVGEGEEKGAALISLETSLVL